MKRFLVKSSILLFLFISSGTFAATDLKLEALVESVNASRKVLEDQLQSMGEGLEEMNKLMDQFPPPALEPLSPPESLSEKEKEFFAEKAELMKLGSIEGINCWYQSSRALFNRMMDAWDALQAEYLKVMTIWNGEVSPMTVTLRSLKPLSPKTIELLKGTQGSLSDITKIHDQQEEALTAAKSNLKRMYKMIMKKGFLGNGMP